jgi:MATE family multidrug resistance protein
MALPLIVSTGAESIQHFIDRMFLTWYSPEAIAAAMPSGTLKFTITSLFLGTASYVNTFVAQYYGAKRYERIGPALWQGLYVALLGGVLHLCFIPLAGPFFRLVGHAELVQQYETIYFQILCLGTTPVIASAVLSGFYAGRGRTWPVMWVNLWAMLVNVVLDYALIFGYWGFPELGIRGAAIATIIANYAAFLVYLVLLSKPVYNQRYHILKGWRLEGRLFAALLRFGFPNGMQFFLDIAGFSAFFLFIGRLGTTALVATNIAININTLAFLPMLGFGITISVLVGQYLGSNRPDMAERSVYSGFHLTFLYMATMAALYVLIPELFIRPFAVQADAENFATIREMTIVLLRFVALYSLFDTLNIVFSFAIRGAGDTRYVMLWVATTALVVLVIPLYIALIVLQQGLYVGWTIGTVYVIILGIGFLFRFLGGKWKSMRVIEEASPPFPVVGSITAPTKLQS